MGPPSQAVEAVGGSCVFSHTWKHVRTCMEVQPVAVEGERARAGAVGCCLRPAVAVPCLCTARFLGHSCGQKARSREAVWGHEAEPSALPQQPVLSLFFSIFIAKIISMTDSVSSVPLTKRLHSLFMDVFFHLPSLLIAFP